MSKTRVLSDNEMEFIRSSYLNGANVQSIRDVLHISSPSLYRHLEKLGVPRRPVQNRRSSARVAMSKTAAIVSVARRPMAPLPVARDSFIQPPTRAQLMGRR